MTGVSSFGRVTAGVSSNGSQALAFRRFTYGHLVVRRFGHRSQAFRQRVKDRVLVMRMQQLGISLGVLDFRTRQPLMDRLCLRNMVRVLLDLQSESQDGLCAPKGLTLCSRVRTNDRMRNLARSISV